MKGVSRMKNNKDIIIVNCLGDECIVLQTMKLKEMKSPNLPMIDKSTLIYFNVVSNFFEMHLA